VPPLLAELPEAEEAPVRVLNASHVADTGGNGYRTAKAFARLTDWHYRATCRTTNYLAYPQDLPWDQALAEWRKADVVHVRDGFQAQARLGAPDRPTVIHHHGTQLRLKHETLIPEQRRRRAIGLAATLDLLAYAPDDLTWAPALYDLGALAAMRRPIDDGVLRIAHAPTNRAVKSTEAFLAAAERLGRELPVEVILIERTPWTECLRRKATADIYFDQVALGYGNNAIEAWGMGIPVVAGAARDTLDEMERRFGSTDHGHQPQALPFLLADEGSIYRALRLLADPEVRAAWGEHGRRHAERWHSEAAGVAFLSAVYRAAYDRSAVAA
jgi:nucleotide-binding universal stress UspA family protein